MTTATRTVKSDYLTTGQIAAICGVAPRTVVKWCEAGRLRHHKLPVSLDRRILRADLREFLLSHGCPVPAALADDRLRIAAGLAEADLAALGAGWQGATEYRLGALVATKPLAAVLIGDAWGVTNAVALAANVAEQQPRATVAIVLSEDAAPPSSWTGRAFRRPVDWSDVLRVMEK